LGASVPTNRKEDLIEYLMTGILESVILSDRELDDCLRKLY